MPEVERLFLVIKDNIYEFQELGFRLGKSPCDLLYDEICKGCCFESEINKYCFEVRKHLPCDGGVVVEEDIRVVAQIGGELYELHRNGGRIRCKLQDICKNEDGGDRCSPVGPQLQRICFISSMYLSGGYSRHWRKL